MKVLHVIKLSGIAGAETYLLNIIPGLNQTGADSTILAVINPSFKEKAQKFLDLCTEKKIRFITIENYSEFSIRFYKKLASIVKDGGYNLVNTHMIHADIYMSFAKLFFFRKMIIAATRHGYRDIYQSKYGFEPVFIWNDLHRYIFRIIDPMINRICSISFGLKKLLVALNTTKSEKIDVIHYGFSYSTVQYDENTNKYRKSPHQILIVGRLSPVKGHEYAFRAMDKVLEKFPDTALVIIGSGPMEKQLKEKVSELGLDRNVYFEGFQINVHNYIKNSDIVLIPSIAEGFCAVVLEAYHNQTLVMSFDVPALNEIIYHNETGVIVNKFDTNDLSNKIIDVFSRPDFYKKMSLNGYDKLKSYFSLDRMVMETISFYQKTLSTSKN